MILIVAIIMMIGLLATVTNKIPGTVIIFGGALVYGSTTGFSTFEPWVVSILLALMSTAEVGSKILRSRLTQNYYLSRSFSRNSTAGNIAVLLASDIIFGPVLGTALWEMLTGKTFFPRWSTIGRVLSRLVAVAALRFTCGLAMIILITAYIFV